MVRAARHNDRAPTTGNKFIYSAVTTTGTMQFAMSARRDHCGKMHFSIMEQHMIFTCEGCRRRTELFHCRSVDEYLCEDCIDQLADEAVSEIEDGERTEGPGLLTSLFDH